MLDRTLTIDTAVVDCDDPLEDITDDEFAYLQDRRREIMAPHPNRDRRTVDTTVNVYLDAESIAIAESLGDGDVSAGIRKALKQAQDTRREP